VLTRVLFVSDKPPNFDMGLMPGVVARVLPGRGAVRRAQARRLQGGASMRRYIVGAMLMGFGGMTGRRLRRRRRPQSGAAIFTLTSFVTLAAIWAAAAATDRLVDRRPLAAPDALCGGARRHRPCPALRPA
jgi:hypothetical protein